MWILGLHAGSSIEQSMTCSPPESSRGSLTSLGFTSFLAGALWILEARPDPWSSGQEKSSCPPTGNTPILDSSLPAVSAGSIRPLDWQAQRGLPECTHSTGLSDQCSLFLLQEWGGPETAGAESGGGRLLHPLIWGRRKQSTRMCKGANTVVSAQLQALSSSGATWRWQPQLSGSPPARKPGSLFQHLSGGPRRHSCSDWLAWPPPDQSRGG